VRRDGMCEAQNPNHSVVTMLFLYGQVSGSVTIVNKRIVANTDNSKTGEISLKTMSANYTYSGIFNTAAR
jgi:hypothetical protein